MGKLLCEKIYGTFGVEMRVRAEIGPILQTHTRVSYSSIYSLLPMASKLRRLRWRQNNEEKCVKKIISCSLQITSLNVSRPIVWWHIQIRFSVSLESTNCPYAASPLNVMTIINNYIHVGHKNLLRCFHCDTLIDNPADRIIIIMPVTTKEHVLH